MNEENVLRRSFNWAFYFFLIGGYFNKTKNSFASIRDKDQSLACEIMNEQLTFGMRTLLM